MNKVIIIFSLVSIIYTNFAPDSTKYKDPNIAWKLAIIPGLGQIYNQQYLKSVIFLSAQGYAANRIHHYSDLNKIGNRNTYIWWLFGLYLLSIIDAYVDAHLSTFPENKEKVIE